MSGCTDVPEDEAISLFAGLLANPDVPLSRGFTRNTAHIEHSHTPLECPRGGSGTVTKVSADRDACFVKWDMTAEECGWYPCGAHGRFSLILLPRHEEKPFYVLDMMRTGGNSEQHIHLCVADYSEKHFYTVDSIVDNVIDLLGF